MESSRTRDFIFHGGHGIKDPVKLHAGSLSMIYEYGSLRYICAGKTELLRMIYPAVRDRYWVTIKPVIQEEEIVSSDNSFRISLRCLYKSSEVNFTARYLIEGREDCSITMTLDGEALDRFERNRIGICVLHPIETCLGKTCAIEHPDGSSSHALFPEEISPHQVFRNIKAMDWPASGGRCRITFEGDIFETEDQRNWTDASFKTYSTPLSIPYPVTLDTGNRVWQKVHFSSENLNLETVGEDSEIIIDLIHEEARKLPLIGIGRSTRPEPITDPEMRVLRPLRFDHYRINLYLFTPGWRKSAEEGLRESELLSYRVEFALFFDDAYEKQLTDFLSWYNEREPQVYCYLIFHRDHAATPERLANYVIPVMMEEIQGVRTATGSNINFAQLNRNRPSDHYANLTCFPIHPQEHASDNLTLVENLKGQAYAVTSAALFSRDRGIWVSPVNIQRRFNPNKTMIEDGGKNVDFPSSADTRILSLFGACWAAISLKYLCENDVSGITFFETVGEKGIFQGEKNSQWPVEFHAPRGMIFPVYFIFKYILKYKSLKVIKSVSSHPLIADSLILSDGKQVRMILVNFTQKSRSIQFNGCKGMLKVMALTADNYAEAVSNHHWNCENDERAAHSGKPILLEPCSITFVEGWMKQ